PDVKLDQALVDYEKVLSDDERVQLRAEGAPDTMAAVAFTALIDKECSKGRRQCMGPRLITFLESVQQFSGVIDTFVSSHPEFAALIANNFSSYFDQLSTLLMNLGRQCPRISTLGSLYPSVGLQRALCDYYAAIVRLCKHIVQFLRKPAYTRILQPSFDHEIGPLEREITKCCQEVKDEAALESNQAQKQESDLQAQERVEAGEHRRSLVKWISKNDTEEKSRRLAVDLRRLKKLKLQALESLSTYDHWRTYKQHRKEWIPDTSEWILENSEFKSWKKGTWKGFWCSGKVTGFFFCRFDDQESLKATTIIGSIAKQLVYDLPEDKFRNFSRETPILEFLKRTLSDTRQYFIILDGLDECNEEQIRETCGILHGLLSLPHLNIKLFWCSRPNVMDWLPPRLQSQKYINLESVESQGHIASDIGKLIHSRLEEWLDGDSPQLRIGDPTLPLIIVQCLENEAQGIEKRSDQQIIDALSHLPRDLPQTYERILAQFTEAEDIDLGSQIFRWVAVAKRPLTVPELREAIGVVPLQDTWNPRSFINDMKRAIACCGNLLFVDEEQQTVHFTHNSVLQYLRSNLISKTLSQYFINLDQADADAGATCVTYLNLPVFNKQLVRRPKVDFNATAVTSTVVKTSLPAGKSANWLALRLLRRQDKSGKSVQRLLEETAGDDELSRRNAILEQHVFFPYAQNFWLEHARHRIMSKSGKFPRLFNNLLEDSNWRGTLSGIPWTFEDWENRSPNVIEWIAENNHSLLAQLLINSERDLTLHNLQVLIEDAAPRGHAEVIEVCLGSRNISQMALDAALRSAASWGHLTLVERLLQEKVNVTATGALKLAAEHGHPSIVKRLLKETSDVTATEALSSAAAKGHLAIVEILLRAVPDVNALAGSYCMTALHIATEGGYLAIVERLLQEGADVNATDLGNSTALHLAVRGGYLAVVERLLQKGADVNATDKYEETALHIAADNGHLAIVERLLKEGSNVNATDDKMQTALYHAASSGHLAIVERLLQGGADVNATDKFEETALHIAAGRDRIAIVERLLQEGADVNATDDYDSTALHYAAGRGHLAVVERLLQEGVDVNATDKRGSTARSLAARNGHQVVAQKLEAAGGKM
ncbi:MAG: hypothetical protein LQ349_005400, partial [Xanthoria aureola]